MTRFPISATALLLAAVTAPLSAIAQTGAIVQPLTPTADRLSDQMRILGRSPNDLSALIEAGRLSGRLGDTDAAMQFLSRAERVSAGDPRIRAARAATLVTMERPGEALALFDSAERAGLAMASYAADRGLAYDLLGFQPNAQREYRLALTQGSDDEVTRRLALSLGISGDVAGATALLNPLLLQNDRAAWRVRACVLAMTGDAAGADRIAATMLPGFGPTLAPFFRRLPQLSGADRAFAVHFGRLGASPERIADARSAPTVTPPTPPVVRPPVAVAAVAAAPVRTRPPTASQRRAEQRRQTEVARVAQADEARRLAIERTQALAKARADEAGRLASLARAQVEQAQRDRDTALRAEQTRLAEAANVEAARAEAMRVEVVRVAAREAEERRIAAEALAERERAASASVEIAATVTPAPSTVATATAPLAPAATAAVAPVSGEDVLARIIRNLAIPAAELGVAPPASASVATLASAAQAARATAQAREDDARAIEAGRAAQAKKVADARAALARKAADVRKAADAKKAEAVAKAEEARKAAALKKADPERHWVQVAGGANVADLPKAWRALAAKVPALKTRQAWTTPLRATNRLLAGPFKTDSEAQAFVNTLGKGGLSAFTFTSPVGQKVARVPAS